MAMRRVADAEDLDLVPVMNLITMLIPFLLMASSFATLATIDTTAPALGPSTEGGRLRLAIAVTDQGWTVLGADEVFAGSDGRAGQGPTVPCLRLGCGSADDYDSRELTRVLAGIKDRHPDEHEVILVPEPQIPYDVLVRTMDAARQDPSVLEDGRPRLLFPSVVIAGGVEERAP